MDEKLEEDWLDTRLREEAPYIDDAGFTAQVVRQLPPARPRRSFRALVLLCITLLGSTLTYTLSGGAKFIDAGINRVAALPLLWIIALALVCSLVLTSVATAAALGKMREEPFG